MALVHREAAGLCLRSRTRSTGAFPSVNGALGSGCPHTGAQRPRGILPWMCTALERDGSRRHCRQSSGLPLPSVQTLINGQSVWLSLFQPWKDPNESWQPLINHCPSHGCSQCRDCALLCFATPVQITCCCCSITIKTRVHQKQVFDNIY